MSDIIAIFSMYLKKKSENSQISRIIKIFSMSCECNFVSLLLRDYKLSRLQKEVKLFVMKP